MLHVARWGVLVRRKANKHSGAIARKKVAGEKVAGEEPSLALLSAQPKKGWGAMGTFFLLLAW
jgi:hypothetical protein